MTRDTVMCRRGTSVGASRLASSRARRKPPAQDPDGPKRFSRRLVLCHDYSAVWIPTHVSPLARWLRRKCGATEIAMTPSARSVSGFGLPTQGVWVRSCRRPFDNHQTEMRGKDA